MLAARSPLFSASAVCACNMVAASLSLSCRLETGQLSAGLQTSPSLDAEPGTSSARAAWYLPPTQLSCQSVVTPIPPSLLAKPRLSAKLQPPPPSPKLL